MFFAGTIQRANEPPTSRMLILRAETPGEHQYRLIKIGIETFQPPEAFHKKRCPDLIKIHETRDLFISACNYNRSIMIPLINFLSKVVIIDRPELPKTSRELVNLYTALAADIIFASDIHNLLLFSAYQTGHMPFVYHFVRYWGAKPLKLLDKAICIKDNNNRKQLLLDMLGQYVVEHSNCQIAPGLFDALQHNTPFATPIEQPVELKKIYRLAKSFLAQPAPQPDPTEEFIASFW